MRVGLAALGLALIGCACPGGRAVEIGALAFCAEVASTEAERAQGLRGRDPLGPGEALLLEFSVEDEICIVNDGVSFAIDAAYADADGVVVALERAIAAGDPTPRCHARTQRVLETAAGELEAAEVGDRLR